MFEKLLALLAHADVRFLVVGGAAVAQAGFQRFTEDIDLLVDADPDNLHRLLDALSGFGDGAARELTVADFPVEEGAVRIIDEAMIDLFTVMSGRTFADLLPQTAVHPVRGESVRFLDAEGLISLKASSLRPKDQIDADALRQILAGRNPN